MLAVLLKGSADDEEDGKGYSEALSMLPGCSCVRVPVLSFEFDSKAVFVFQANLASFDAVLVTSPRAVQAVHHFVLPEVRTRLSRLVWLVVGEASGTAVKSLINAQDVRGADAGSAQALVDGHLADISRVAYLCGNLRRPTISVGLTAAGIKFDEFVVYKTVPDLSAVLPTPAKEVKRICCFFSPSGVTAVGKQVDASKDAVVAIGDTTRQALVGAGISVHAVASCPTPRGLAEAVKTVY